MMPRRFSSHPSHLPLAGGRRKFLRGRPPAEQGLTIMECLVAILLIGLTTAMITPPLLVATATRVQNRRTEQAIQLAQDEIDRINTLVQRGIHESQVLPAVAAGATSMDKVSAPTTATQYRTVSKNDCPKEGLRYNYDPKKPISATEALKVDIDGDCEIDFLVQVFRTAGEFTPGELNKTDPNTRKPARFDLGVRVYSVLAQRNLSTGKLGVEPASLQLTQGQGKQASNPLAVVYRTLIWTEDSDTLCNSLSAENRAKLTTCDPPRS